MSDLLTLITGASGFVGHCLLERLHGDRPLRCIVRPDDELDAPPGVDVLIGDLADAEAVARAVRHVDCAYYLVHSMEAGADDDFAARDRGLAQTFAAVASEAGVRRVVYLGGIEARGGSSEHLDSRHQVEAALSRFEGEFVALRAAMIVGAGSASFDTLAQIVERLPVLALPPWRERECQPVAIDDVIAALAASDHVAPGRYDLGGPDRLTFEAMTERIAELLGKHRRSIDLPFSSSRLEGTVASLATDQDRELLVPLMAGLDADLIVEDNALQPVFGIPPTPFDVAARSALADLTGQRAA